MVRHRVFNTWTHFGWCQVIAYSRIEIVIVTVIVIKLLMVQTIWLWSGTPENTFGSGHRKICIVTIIIEMRMVGRDVVGNTWEHFWVRLHQASMGRKFSQCHSNHTQNVPRKVINSRQPFCPGLRRAGVATRVNQHLSIDCANTLGPGHSMIKQCLVSACPRFIFLKNSLSYITDTNIWQF